MRYSFRNGILWLLIYLLLGLIPLGIAAAGDVPEYRTFWIELGAAFGFTGLSLFGLQFLFSGRFERIAPYYGMDNIMNFHRETGIIAFLFILAHPLTLILAHPGFLSYFDPSVNFVRAVALSFVMAAVILIVISSLYRVTFGLSYERWRLLHGFLAAAIVFIGIVHSIQVSHYLEPMWKKLVIVALLSGCIYLVVHTRLVRPWRNRRKPYEVVATKKEMDDSWSMTIKPKGHSKMTFIPGQFAWITRGPTPFSLQQHPFSFASSARQETITFTAKEEGDFTSTWKETGPGTKVWLEGPFGSFTRKENSDLFFIMGGIGITPAMSILRTLRDDQDPAKVILIYANPSVRTITFRDELEELSREINLRVVHLLEKPPEDWPGETGLVSRELLEKYLPENPDRFIYYICGPDPMMDIAETSLRDLGIGWDRIYTERFQIV